MPAHVRCRICDTALPPAFLDLGTMPLANSFLPAGADPRDEPAYPLAVAACPSCGLVQLTHVVPAEILYRDYIYVSSTSDAVRAHAAALAERLIARHGWTSADLVAEIASNDGTVLKEFRRRGVGVLGIEPARNIAALASADGIETVPEFFDEGLGRALGARRRAAGILARHVVAHVDDLRGLLRGVDHLLAPDGVFVLEVPYLGDLLAQREFDTIYHEHLSYFALRPLARLCRDLGLVVVDVERVGLHGGSMIVSIARAGAPSPRVTAMLEDEARRGMDTAPALAAFAADVVAWRARFTRFVDALAEGGARLAGYGAAAKANTLLNYCPEVARRLRYILDRSPHKHGKLTPGTHVAVRPVDAWRDDPPTHLLILAWNFKDEIVRQMKPYADEGGRFVIPIPEPGVL
jgi:novobiocin biosynthesis protein NovU/D-mycarose 3-C-methyltransferase